MLWNKGSGMRGVFREVGEQEEEKRKKKETVEKRVRSTSSGPL